MHQSTVLHLATQAMTVLLTLAGPILGVSLAVGLLVSLFQATTQIQEYTLSFVPKLAAVGLVILVAGHWMLSDIVNYTTALFASVPRLLVTG